MECGAGTGGGLLPVTPALALIPFGNSKRVGLALVPEEPVQPSNARTGVWEFSDGKLVATRAVFQCSRPIQTLRTVLPLLGGEGRGEGEEALLTRTFNPRPNRKQLSKPRAGFEAIDPPTSPFPSPLPSPPGRGRIVCPRRTRRRKRIFHALFSGILTSAPTASLKHPR